MLRLCRGFVFGVLGIALVCCRTGAPGMVGTAKPRAWVKRSNRHARVLFRVMERFRPEAAAFFGIEGIDDRIMDIRAGFSKRRRAAIGKAAVELQKRLGDERDPRVREDLQIMTRWARDEIRLSRLEDKYLLGFINLARTIFFSMRALLNAQVPPRRRAAALVRLRRYTGMEKGYRPVTELALERLRRRMGERGLRRPSRAELTRVLGDGPRLVAGIGGLFKRFGLRGYLPAFERLKGQLGAYHSFVRTRLLPQVSNEFRLPRELYEMKLSKLGVDLAAAKVAAMARAAFGRIQRKMQSVAAQVAKRRGLPGADYRQVIMALKREQLSGKKILAHYEDRLGQVESIIRRKGLLTLPARKARIRLASAAESAAVPAPNMRPPRLLGNRGESGTFVLPLRAPARPGAKGTLAIDDFTFAAASWTLTAHEARPGHELQFAALVERGVSNARVVFALNSTNIEGWGLYSEAIVLPYMPPEGKLISLQFRLLRAARAFLDPELQAGTVTPKEAFRLLREDVVLSEAMSRQEVERYTFRAPGQATSYFYGYTKLIALRRECERALGRRFVAGRFHDFILAQGLLPHALLRRRVLEWLEREKKRSR